MNYVQWFKNGDHPEDGPSALEGKVVRYFRDPDISGDTICDDCNQEMNSHGWIDQSEYGYVVCPGDYIFETSPGVYKPLNEDLVEIINGMVENAIKEHNKAIS